MINTRESCTIIRRKIVEILFSSQASHLGSNMSVVEILDSIYGYVDLDLIKLKSEDRDFVIVSKGHCAAAVYSTLNYYGLLSDEDINGYHSTKSLLQGHVSHGVESVEHSTGALGHGLSVAVGIAIGKKSKNIGGNVYVILGDGEIQEGSIWEALMLASSLKLTNLKIFIDNNKISSITETEKVLSTGPIKNRFEGFGLNVFELDGHNRTEITNHLKLPHNNSKPNVFICNTVKGKGISFSENQAIWHYRTLNLEMKQRALGELN